MKPSERLKEIIQQIKEENLPNLHTMIPEQLNALTLIAIVEYLDEQYELNKSNVL